MFVKNGSAETEEIEAFEKRIGFRLPEDYRHFLHKTNGGYFENCIVKLTVPDDFLMGTLFGINIKKSLDLYLWFEEMDEEIPTNSLIIGGDAGGGLILLGDGESFGVYYYDYSHFYSSSSESGNTYKISDTFLDFLHLCGYSEA